MAVGPTRQSPSLLSPILLAVKTARSLDHRCAIGKRATVPHCACTPRGDRALRGPPWPLGWANSARPWAECWLGTMKSFEIIQIYFNGSGTHTSVSLLAQSPPSRREDRTVIGPPSCHRWAHHPTRARHMVITLCRLGYWAGPTVRGFKYFLQIVLNIQIVSKLLKSIEIHINI
jgi:hypothetical protein